MQQQLKGLFVTHRPGVVRGVQDDLAKCLAAIKEWLAKSGDWILVFEDASPASATLWDLLPKDTGRVLVTSQAPLHGKHTEFTGIQLNEPESYAEDLGTVADAVAAGLPGTDVLAEIAAGAETGERGGYGLS